MFLLTDGDTSFRLFIQNFLSHILDGKAIDFITPGLKIVI